MTGGWMAGDRWLTDELPCVMSIWLVTVTGGRSLMSSYPVGKWSVADWLVAAGLTLWVQVPLELPPRWVLLRGAGPLGGDPIQFFIVWKIRHGLRSLLLLSHDPLSKSVSSSFLGKFPSSVRPGATCVTGWFSGTTRTFNAFVMIIPTRFYMTTFTTNNRHGNCENSLQQRSKV